MIYVIIMFCIGFIIGGFSSGNNTLGILGIIGTIVLTIFGITKQYLEERRSDKTERESAYKQYFSGNNPIESNFSKNFVRYKDYPITTFIQENEIPIELLETTINIGDYEESRYDKKQDCIFLNENDIYTKDRFNNTLIKCFEDAKLKISTNKTNNSQSKTNINKITSFNKNDIDSYTFDIYSLQDYSKFAKRYYCEIMDVDISNFERDDYPEMVDKILKILEIEDISFKEFVINFEKIRTGYYQWGDKCEISQKYRLYEALDFFYDYLRDIRIKKISYVGFNKFLIKEAQDNEVYLKNKPNKDESIVSAILNGKNPIEKLDSNQIPLFIERLKYVLKKERKSLMWLCNNISSLGCDALNNEYLEFENPSLDLIIKWFFIYYKKTITTM